MSELRFKWHKRDGDRIALGMTPDGRWNAELPCGLGTMVGVPEEDREIAERDHLATCPRCLKAGNMGKRCETCKWWTPADADEVKERKDKGLSCFGLCGWWAERNLPACIINEDYWTIYDDEGSDCSCWEAKTVSEICEG